MLHPDPAARINMDDVTLHRFYTRKSSYLDNKGLCRNAAMLAKDMLDCLKEHGFIEQASAIVMPDDMFGSGSVVEPLSHLERGLM